MTLVAIGGAEDKTGDMTVLKRVIAESGVERPCVHVITSATAYPAEAEERYRNAFRLLGLEIAVSHIETPAQASGAALLAEIAKADVVFFSGGDQSKITAAINGTPLQSLLQKMESAGAVIAGTSAGAAAMSFNMIAGGDAEKNEVEMSTGLELRRDVIFDTHFMNRGRLGRLFTAVAGAPGKTGVGLDEDTALVLRNDGSLHVAGSGAVTIVNGTQSRSYKAGDKPAL